MAKILLPITIICGLLYPFVVYIGIDYVPPALFVGISLLLIAMRLLSHRRYAEKAIPRCGLIVISGLTIGGMLLILWLRPHLAVKAYPIIMSLIFAMIFSLSLLFPPSIIERIARLTEPYLPPSAITYTRNVTIIWAVFLIINAMISLATALWGTQTQWIMWNGLFSYICMGILFTGEFCVRKIVRRNAAKP